VRCQKFWHDSFDNTPDRWICIRAQHRPSFSQVLIV
jgi:hypothetical protein